MNIRTSEDELFAEWRAKRRGFVADGVVDESAYLQSSRKLLFVLKEVNDPDGGGWDLREFVKTSDRTQTWNNIARWVEGIRRLDEDIPWSELVEIDGERRRETLKSIAAVNLKKSPGGHTTDSAELAKTSEEDRVFLTRQFALYAPDVIVCCGTSDLFHRLVPICEQPQWKSTRRGVRFHEYRPGQFVLEYSHPEARCAAPLLYYGLIDAIREILIQQSGTVLQRTLRDETPQPR
jgi:hypothetical protein